MDKASATRMFAIGLLTLSLVFPPEVFGGDMEKRVVFRSAWLPYALVAPQIAITIVFFFWPAIQAGW